MYGIKDGLNPTLQEFDSILNGFRGASLRDEKVYEIPDSKGRYGRCLEWDYNKYFSSKNIPNSYKMVAAIKNGDEQRIRELVYLDRMDVNLPLDTAYANQKTPVALAVSENKPKPVQFFLSLKSVHLNTHDRYSNTPLHNAIDKPKIMKMLLTAPDIDPNRFDENGCTPLQIAARTYFMKHHESPWTPWVSSERMQGENAQQYEQRKSASLARQQQERDNNKRDMLEAMEILYNDQRTQSPVKSSHPKFSPELLPQIMEDANKVFGKSNDATVKLDQLCVQEGVSITPDASDKFKFRLSVDPAKGGSLPERVSRLATAVTAVMDAVPHKKAVITLGLNTGNVYVQTPSHTGRLAMQKEMNYIAMRKEQARGR